MKLSQRSWNWWFVLSILLLFAYLLLAMVATESPEAYKLLNSKGMNFALSVWMVQFVLCIYIGLLPVEQQND
jgi:hypothetical protein